MQVLKLGGSVVTHRRRAFAFRHEAVERLAGEMAAHAGSLVLVHGVGSFGRALARHFDGGGVSEEQAILARRVQRVLRELQDQVADTLSAASIPAVNLDAASLFARADGGVPLVCPDSVRFHLERGRVPVLSGFLVPHASGGYAVLSSDLIAAELAPLLAAERVVWATDVEGVLGEAGVLPRLSVRDRERVLVSRADAGDPTGAMTGKLEAVFRLAARGVPSLIVNGLVAGRVERALAGDSSGGTLVVA